MLTIKELESKWNSISPYSGGFLLISGEYPLSLHIGYFGHEQKCFMIMNTGKDHKIFSSKAITAEYVQTGTNEFSLRFLLNYPSLDELFVKLCWDLLDSSYNSTTPIKRLLEQYNSWRYLLQQAEDRVMPSSSQKGLIAELLYLDESIDKFGIEPALNAWIGPEGSDQDFVFPNEWAEVKAVSISSTEVTISSLQQLDREDDGQLIVYFMDKTTSGGKQTISLNEVIGEIRAKISDLRLRNVFDCKLAKYGFLDKDAESYKEYRYRLVEKHTFSVGHSFPRLTRKNIPVAITNAKYGINLAIIDSFRI